MGEKHEIYPYPNLFSRKFDTQLKKGRSPGLRLVVYLPILDLGFKNFDLGFQ
jgi:hypothetical protein